MACAGVRPSLRGRARPLLWTQPDDFLRASCSPSHAARLRPIDLLQAGCYRNGRSTGLSFGRRAFCPQLCQGKFGIRSQVRQVVIHNVPDQVRADLVILMLQSVAHALERCGQRKGDIGLGKSGDRLADAHEASLDRIPCESICNKLVSAPIGYVTFDPRNVVADISQTACGTTPNRYGITGFDQPGFLPYSRFAASSLTYPSAMSSHGPAMLRATGGHLARHCISNDVFAISPHCRVLANDLIMSSTSAIWNRTD